MQFGKFIITAEMISVGQCEAACGMVTFVRSRAHESAIAA